MPLGYDIYADIGLLYIRGQGVTTQRERMSAMLAWLREPQYENCTDALIDFTDVTAAPKVGELRADRDAQAGDAGPRPTTAGDGHVQADHVRHHTASREAVIHDDDWPERTRAIGLDRVRGAVGPETGS